MVQGSKTHKTAVFGARGYSGLELARVLLKHPAARLEACFATSDQWKLSDFLPDSAAAQVPVRAMSELPALASTFDTAFLATPAEVSLELAPQLLRAGVNVIDLSGAFRLAPADFEKWYALAHPCPELVASAQYGLVPWAGPMVSTTPASAGKPVLIANPGCYATSILMGLIPLLRSRLIRPESLVIDAKSGASGAGRKASENLLFNEVEGECLPYRVGKHQHLPEIVKYAAKFAGAAIDPLFTTHLLPVRRGIIAGIYARLDASVAKLTPAEALARVGTAFGQAYADYPLVSHGPVAANAGMLSLKRVAGSARTQISYSLEGDKLFVFSCIDNLMKGAASQAVENFNRLHDLPATLSLTEWEGVL